MKNLILLTTSYPFGNVGEAFLETEIVYLSKYFDRITIIATKPDSRLLRSVPSNTVVLEFPNNRIVWRSICVILGNGYTIVKYLLPETSVIFRKIDFYTINRFMETLKHLVKALLIKKFILQNIQLSEGKVIIYSYWFNGAALAAGILNKDLANVKAISRLHGWDLYTESHAINYFPFQGVKAKLLDKCIFISDHGKNYFENKYGIYGNSLVSKLGTTNNDKPHLEPADNKFHILSCSSLHKDKRINYIIESIALINDLELCWTHIGGGELFNDLNKLARLKLGCKENITYQFLGSITNKNVFQFYKQNYVHLFITASESEGIPVSIMEAMSFGIPVIATDVGGTSEIVDSACGVLLAKDCSYSDIKDAIMKIHSDYSLYPYRENAYNKWQSDFNAEINYKNFAEEISSLL